MALVVAAHWIAFGTLPHSPKAGAYGSRSQSAKANSISLHITSASKLKTADAPAKPIEKKPAVAPKPAGEIVTTPAESLPIEPLDEDFLGVAGMLDDESPITLMAPQPTRLQYAGRGVVKGRPVTFGAELIWQHDEKAYNAKLDMGDPLLVSRTLLSQGMLTDRGLEPARFEDQASSDSAAQFDHTAGKVRFDGQAPEVDLTLGAQDQLSVFVQMAAVFLGNADRLPAGSTLAFQAVGARASARWAFTVVNFELITLPTGPINAIHLTRDAGADQDTTFDLWLAPETGYLPLRIRIADNNGNFVEQEWQPVDKP